MRLHEYEAADIFENHGILVPLRKTAETTEEVVAAAEEIGFPVILKAQVLVGGRGLAGGIKSVRGPDEARDCAQRLFSTDIKGFPVNKILVSRKVSIKEELYIGITVDGYSGKPVVVASTEGGVSIEETAANNPGKVVSLSVNNQQGLLPWQARRLVKKLGVTQKPMIQFADIVVKLYKVFKRMNAVITEINPLAVIDDGSLMAVDAVLEVDDSAVYRLGDMIPLNPGRIENQLERKGKELGVTYVDLDGDIGIIASGAGLGMATMDIIGQRLKPANFLETGGGITEELLYNSMELVLRKKGLKAMFINVYGGINPIHEGARGIVRYIRENNVSIPVVAKALGNRQEETWEILRSGGVHVVTDVPTEKAVERLFELVDGK